MVKGKSGDTFKNVRCGVQKGTHLVCFMDVVEQSCEDSGGHYNVTVVVFLRRESIFYSGDREQEQLGSPRLGHCQDSLRPIPKVSCRDGSAVPRSCQLPPRTSPAAGPALGAGGLSGNCYGMNE